MSHNLEDAHYVPTDQHTQTRSSVTQGVYYISKGTYNSEVAVYYTGSTSTSSHNGHCGAVFIYIYYINMISSCNTCQLPILQHYIFIAITYDSPPKYADWERSHALGNTSPLEVRPLSVTKGPIKGKRLHNWLAATTEQSYISVSLFPTTCDQLTNGLDFLLTQSVCWGDRTNTRVGLSSSVKFTSQFEE